MLCVAVLAIVTGSVLIVGYALAGAAFLLIVALMIRRIVGNHVGTASNRRRTLLLASRRELNPSEHRRAA
jgi:hypothetical protein